MRFRIAFALSALLLAASPPTIAAPANSTAQPLNKSNEPAAGPRERLLMDFGWRFRDGDSSDVGTSLDYPEAKDLAKVRKADLKVQDKLLKEQAKSADPHLGEKLEFVQPKFDDSSWRALDLPHDWAVELPFSEKADANHGFKDIDPAKGTNIGWYRKTFDLPESDHGKSLWLEFDGVYRNSLVWINGHFLGRHVSGYTSFFYDISKYANFGGRNTLVVRVDASRYEGWFYEGAGIYRHVWLVKTGPVHVAHWGTYLTTDVKGKDATVSVRTTLRNESDKRATVSLVSEVFDTPLQSCGIAKTGDIAIDPGAEKTIDQKIALKDAKLWSLESPHLYNLRSTVSIGPAPVDVYETPFGVRTIEFTADNGFLLNGKRVEIKGTCDHQDHAGVGTAIPDRLQVYRIEKLQEMGSNAIRTSHNPPTPELLDACDRLGMLVMDESRRSGTEPEALNQLSSLIERDRNHPCVILWSIGNEEFRDNIQGDNDIGVKICQVMQDRAYEVDPSRHCTAAMNGSWGEGFSKVIDVQGFNYPTRAKGGGGGKLGLSADDFHKTFPDKPCTGSEDGSTRCTRGIYAVEPEHGFMSAYDKDGTSTAEKWWNFYFNRPFLAGSFVWTGFDYRGEPTPYKWPCISSQFGILDTCGFPKDNFYYYQAWWTDKPVLHILPHWNWEGKEGQEINVWVHSNCDEVELFLNGESLGRQKMVRNSHLEWKVQYAPGTLLAKGYRGGKEIAQEKVETTGKPARIVMSPDRASIKSDGEDVSVINVKIVDSRGRTVPTAENLVKFELDGPGKIIGVGNGNPSCQEPDKARERSAFGGLCMAIMQTTKSAGDIHLKALSDGLESATVMLHAETTTPRPTVKSVGERTDKSAEQKQWSGGLSLSEPQDWQVFQRQSRTEGKIHLTGQYPEGTQLEYRLIGKAFDDTSLADDWRPLKISSTAPQNFQADLVVPAGGWYQLELVSRFPGKPGIEINVDHVGIGEVFIVAGQSNAANYGSERQQPKSGMVASFDGTLWHVADDPQRGAGGGGGSFMPAFGDAMAARFHVPIGVVPIAVGSTSVREWLPKGMPVNRLTTTGRGLKEIGPGQWEALGDHFAALCDRIDKLEGSGCRAILWHQGESDAGQAQGSKNADRQISGDDYVRYMTLLINATREKAGTNVPWFTAQATYHSEQDPTNEEFRAAQKTLWDKGISFAGSDTDTLGAEYRNGVHFNAQGLQKHGELWAEKVGDWLEGQLKEN